MSIKNLINHIETLDYQSRLLTNDNTTYAIWNDYMELKKDIVILKEEKGGDFFSFTFCSELFSISSNNIAAHFLVNSLNCKTEYGHWTVKRYENSNYISYQTTIHPDFDLKTITNMIKQFSQHYALFVRAISRFEKEKGVDGSTLAFCMYLSEFKNLDISEDEMNYLIELQTLIEEEKIEEHKIPEKDQIMLNKLYENQFIEIEGRIQFLTYKYYHHIRNTVINLKNIEELKNH